MGLDAGGGHHVILYGGNGTGAGLDDTWSWDGTKWTQVTPVGPGERWVTAMAPLNGQLVLFGGFQSDNGTTWYADTDVFDGSMWNTTSAFGPGARGGHCMASLGGSKVVLFGGWNGNKVLYDTWIYDGSKWTQGPNGPGMRYECAMAPFGGSVLLFGGQSDTSGTLLPDSWLFDGTKWTPVTGPGPSARTSMSMAARAGTVVMFGGSDASGLAPDTWVFTGSWGNANVSGPPGRIEGQMATFGNTVLLYGGGSMSDMWSFDGASWTGLGAGQAPGIRNAAAMATLP
jgi:hypothetical protein